MPKGGNRLVIDWLAADKPKKQVGCWNSAIMIIIWSLYDHYCYYVSDDDDDDVDDDDDDDDEYDYDYYYCHFCTMNKHIQLFDSSLGRRCWPTRATFV